LSEIAVQAAQRGAMLVSQLLAFGRRQSLQPQSIRLDHVLQDIRLLIGPAAGGEVTLETELAPDLWACYADRAQLEAGISTWVGGELVPDDSADDAAAERDPDQRPRCERRIAGVAQGAAQRRVLRCFDDDGDLPGAAQDRRHLRHQQATASSKNSG
jgi:hypothetical protein